jgi:hypothetical protein
MFQTKVIEKIKNTHFMFSKLFFEILVVYEIMWKNNAEPGRQQMTILSMRKACWILKPIKHTITVCNTYCFSTAIMIERKQLKVTLHKLSCFSFLHSWRKCNISFTIAIKCLTQFTYQVATLFGVDNVDVIFAYSTQSWDRDSSVGMATGYGLDGRGDRIPVGARFFAHVQTGPGVHPASCTMGTRSFLVVKRPGRGADHPSPSSVEVTNEYSYTSTPPLGLRGLFYLILHNLLSQSAYFPQIATTQSVWTAKRQDEMYPPPTVSPPWLTLRLPNLFLNFSTPCM